MRSIKEWSIRIVLIVPAFIAFGILYLLIVRNARKNGDAFNCN
jgi:hypothetical protein